MSGHKITKSVSFDSVKHKRILEMAEATGNFSGAVQAALTAYFGMERGVTLGMVYARQGEILRRLENGVVAGGEAAAASNDEGDVLSADILEAFG